MTYALTYYSTITNGKMQKNVLDLIAEQLIYFEGKRVEIIIKRIKSKRSQQQNKYLHVLFQIFTNELNALGNEFTMPEIKELCKCKFSKVDVVNENTGEILGQRIKGTSEMNKTEISDFIEKTIRWAADTFNIKLPYPNEELVIGFE